MNLNQEIERITRALTSFKVDPRSRFAFALPIAAMPMTCATRLIRTANDGATIMPGDSRWNAPGCKVTGPVDPEVSFAVAVCHEFFEVES
jgi:hypothetical protein